MGSYFTNGFGKRDVVADIKHQIDESANLTLLESSIVGNTLWTVENVVRANGTAVKVIGCYKLMGHRDGWGYKPMDETQGPIYYDCPLRFLKLADAPQNDYSKAWRAKVEAYHAAKAKQRQALKEVAPGVTLVLKAGCKPAKLACVSVGKRIIGQDEKGGRYSVPKSYIVGVEIHAPGAPETFTA